MKRLIQWLSVLGVMVCTAALAADSLQPYQKPKFRPMTDRNWIDRSWEARYFIEFSTYWDVSQKNSRIANMENNNFGRFEEFVDYTHEFKLNGASEALYSVLIEFDNQGHVVSPNNFPGKWRVGYESILWISLYDSEKPSTKTYSLAQWFLGLGDVSTHWAPGWCTSSEVPDPLSATNINYLYGPKFDRYAGGRTFGCREWAYQLYDTNRPYIDVTSYSPRNKYYPDGSYIREFIGWARFGDSKPIIGKHGKQWYCLHDCPNQDKPGPIPNIKLWAAHQGWAPPEPPKRMPMFPDPKRRALEEAD